MRQGCTNVNTEVANIPDSSSSSNCDEACDEAGDKDTSESENDDDEQPDEEVITDDKFCFTTYDIA